MSKRTIEVFSAGCPCCDDAVKLVKGLACPDCDVRVLDMRTDVAAQARARELGVRRVPAVAVNGKLADCCHGGVDAAALQRLGVGVAA
jgi:glutaredoxin